MNLKYQTSNLTTMKPTTAEEVRAEDLRLWNYIMSAGVIMPITGILRDRIEIGDGIHVKRDCMHLIEGVPLSPYLLEKCGFVKDTLHINGAEVSFTCGMLCFIFVEDGERWTELNLPHIKYLHQLQNLTHSLGTQLTISL